MPTNRRTFLKTSASTAAALAMASPAQAADSLVASGASERSAEPRGEALRLHARPLALDSVRLTGGPLQHAQQLTAAYLLSLETDRMLAYYRIRAGLKPNAEGYTG